MPRPYYLRSKTEIHKAVFASADEASLPTGLTACAGVSIVKSHYPFARAYELAEELCQSAKKLVQKTPYSGLDWHFTAGGLYSDLETMREREYDVRDGSLTLRPVFLNDTAHAFQSWKMVERIVTEFQQKWSSHRSKAKELMDVLRQGPEATKAYQIRTLKPQNLPLPGIPSFDGNGGWHENQCGYYDSLELLDLYVPLNTYVEVAHG